MTEIPITQICPTLAQKQFGKATTNKTENFLMPTFDRNETPEILNS